MKSTDYSGMIQPGKLARDDGSACPAVQAAEKIGVTAAALARAYGHGLADGMALCRPQGEPVPPEAGGEAVL
jgi:hypothetical protein